MENQQLKLDRLEWSESGLKLLHTINTIIDDNGGLESYHKKVVHELENSTLIIEKRRLAEICKETIKYKIPYRAASVMANMSYYNFSIMINKYKSENNQAISPFF